MELPVIFLFRLQKISLLHSKDKKGQRSDPTFVNLKSNTMKNTMQSYGLFEINNRWEMKMVVFNVFINRASCLLFLSRFSEVYWGMKKKSPSLGKR